MLNKLPRIKPALSLLEGQLPIVNISTIPTPNAFEFLLREQACEAVLYCNVDKTELQGPFITCSAELQKVEGTQVIQKALGVATFLKQLLIAGIVDKHLVLACPYMC